MQLHVKGGRKRMQIVKTLVSYSMGCRYTGMASKYSHHMTAWQILK